MTDHDAGAETARKGSNPIPNAEMPISLASFAGFHRSGGFLTIQYFLSTGLVPQKGGAAQFSMPPMSARTRCVIARCSATVCAAFTNISPNEPSPCDIQSYQRPERWAACGDEARAEPEGRRERPSVYRTNVQ
jgi:hypothetical protein